MAKFALLLAGAALASGLVAIACGLDTVSADSSEIDGGLPAEDGDVPDAVMQNPPTPSFSIGGTVIGLTGSGLVLQNNGADDVAVSANGAFVFPTKIETGRTFAVTVKTYPSSPSQICIVSGGVGTVATADIGTVTVDCTTSKYTVGGHVTGLALGNQVVLQNNGGDDLTVTGNGVFTFPSSIESGHGFAVSVSTQPNAPNQECVVTGGTGSIVAGNVVTVSVNCATDTYTAGGSVTGLDGVGLVLQNNDGGDIPINANGSFAFPPQTDGSAYAVTVKTQPTAKRQLCSVTNGTGVIAGANVTNVAVSCVTQYTIGGIVSGLATGAVVLTANGNDDVTVDANGTFTFTMPVGAGSTYAVAVKTQPADRECTVASGAGTVSADVTNVVVTCTHVGCRNVSGLLWCKDVVANRGCDAFCSATGLGVPVISDPDWIAAQDSEGECAALASAFGLATTNVGAHVYGCAEAYGAELSCSTDPSCPASLRMQTDTADGTFALCPCGPAAVCGAANDGETATLTCPPGTVIASIAFASYGLPDGACGAFASGSCDSPTSRSVVESKCIGKSSCTVGASSAVFGDPCPAESKRLRIQADCQ